MKPSENLMKVLLVGDYPPPYGGVSVHVEVVHQAVRAQGGICQVLDVGKGHLPADGVVPATGYLACAAHLARYALRGYRIHVHTSGANPKSWMLASVCAAAGRLSPQPPIVTFHSGLGPVINVNARYRATGFLTPLRSSRCHHRCLDGARPSRRR